MMVRVCVVLAVCACVSAPAQEALDMSDDFSQHKAGSDGSPAWEPDSIVWEVRDEAYHVDGSLAGFSVLADETVYTTLSVEAVVRVLEAPGQDWEIAGVSVYRDAQNFWHLALVESPDEAGKDHFVELCEMREGRWLAQQNLTSTGEGDWRLDWQYDHPYRLRIAMTPEGIQGTLSELDGTVRARRRYEFSDVAVTEGRPALHVKGFVAAFDEVKMAGSGGRKLETPEKAYAEYDVAAFEGLMFEATGFFHTAERDGVWWVADPGGKAFYAVGTDHCRFEGHWCEKLGYPPHHKVTEKKYGTRERWAEAATGRLKDWGFNLLGAGNDAAARYQGLAHTLFVAFGSTFSSHDDICPKVHWTGFPNVFSAKWEAYCDHRARQTCRENRDDPWLFGYFLDNELEWYGKSHTEWGLFDEAMKKPADHTAKQAAIGQLRGKYETIGALNRAWGAKVESWEALAELEEVTGENAEQVHQDKIEYTRLVAEKYFAITTAAIRKYDPNHMIIGSRFAGNAPAGIWDINGKYCDIVTFNYYGRVDLETEEAPGLAERFTEYYEQAQKPMMITEWSFPALDSGLPCKHGAGQRFDTQEQRAKAFEIFQTMVFRLPFMVGSDYFMWVDEPELGISSTFPEDTNYGLINEQDEPYPELTAAATRLNPQVYEIHSQQFPDIVLSDLVWRNGEASVRVANRGQAAARCEVAFSAGGATRTADLELPGGEERTAKAKLSMEGAGALLVAEADPERKLADPHRADNRLTEVVYGAPKEWALQESAPQGRAAILLANDSDSPAARIPLTISLGQIAGARWEGVQRERVALVREDGTPVRMQFDAAEGGLTPETELCFEAPEIAPKDAAALFLYVCRRPTAHESGAGSVDIEARPEGFVARLGELTLAKREPDGDFIDEIKLGDIALGRYNPLIWQSPGQDQWVQASKFDGATIDAGLVRTTIDCAAIGGNEGVITAVDDEGRQAEMAGRPVPFRVRHRIALYPDRPWFAAKFLSVENLGKRPLTMRGYFFYLLPSIGGDPEGDETAWPDVPNYYAPTGAAWADEQVGAALGVLPDRERKIKTNFWKDEGGGFHADAWYQFEEPVVVPPGETFSLPDAPWVYVYGSRDVKRPWAEATADLRGLDRVVVEVGKWEAR